MLSQRKSERCKNKSKEDKSPTTEDKQAIETIENIFTNQNPTIKDVLVVLKEIFMSQQFIASKYDELLSRNLELELLCNKLTNENSKLKTDVEELKQETERIGNTLNDHKIEIKGIPYKQNENITEIVKKIAENLDNPIKTEDIDNAYRVGIRDNKKTSPIVISFIRKSSKEKFLMMRKKRSMFADEIGFEDNRSQIFINDYLSKKGKELLWKTKKAKIEKKYKFMWIKYGTILIRKNENSEVIKIITEEDLNKIT